MNAEEERLARKELFTFLNEQADIWIKAMSRYFEASFPERVTKGKLLTHNMPDLGAIRLFCEILGTVRFDEFMGHEGAARLHKFMEKMNYLIFYLGRRREYYAVEHLQIAWNKLVRHYLPD